MNDYIRLGHGSGGKLMHELLHDIFYRHFGHHELKKGADSALFQSNGHRLAFTTDSFVVNPLFFPGGDIGKLAVCGTVNDLAVCGAIPQYLSTGFILEEGFSIEKLEKIVISMAREAKNSGVNIVTGDTKVVHKGMADKLFINTSGVGYIPEYAGNFASDRKIKKGDVLIINGSLGDHAIAVLSEREELPFQSQVRSDCASLNQLIHHILKKHLEVKFMRDLTRGGLATCLNEIAQAQAIGIEIQETRIPVKASVEGICETLGFDPLYLANEGKVVIIVSAKDANEVLETLKADDLGKESAIIGRVTSENGKKVTAESAIGGKRILQMRTGEQLPRIC